MMHYICGECKNWSAVNEVFPDKYVFKCPFCEEKRKRQQLALVLYQFLDLFSEELEKKERTNFSCRLKVLKNYTLSEQDLFNILEEMEKQGEEQKK